jgi:alkanesulfonate monooxygenase SsuD/methylene tetrahydromethanopterin reductase-like flavin-dependent oxidoreductase (luciferase family)
LVYVGAADEQAREEGQALMWYLQAVQHPGFMNPPGYQPPEVSARMYLGERRRASGKSGEELNESGIAIWGNPDTVIKKITYLHERCQVGHLMMMMQAGFMPTAHTRKSLKLFAEKV